MKKKYIVFFITSLFSIFYSQNNQLIFNNNVLMNDVVYYCSSEEFNLKVDAQASATGDYKVETIGSFNISNGNTTVPFFNTNGNNHFSKPVTLPFTFSFYGVDYNQVVVGSNGRLVFGNDNDFQNLHTSQFSDIVHSGNDSSSNNIKLQSLAYNTVDLDDPNRYVNISSIFIGFTDLNYYNPSEYDKIKYRNVSYDGKQGFLISFDNIVERTTNYSKAMSSQILLLSDNSFIIKVIKNSTLQNAILGIQNVDATKFLVANNDAVYNNGKWTSNGSIAWKFTPNQQLTPKIKWFNNGKEVGNTVNFSVAPKENSETIKVEIAYYDASNQQVGNTEMASISLKKIQQVSISAPSYSNGCGQPAELHVLNPDPSLQYYWYNVNDLSTPIASNVTTVNVSSGSYLVKAKSYSGGFCGDSDVKIVNISSVLPPFLYEGKTLYECDKSSQSEKSFVLSDLVKYHSSSSYTVEFYDENGTLIPSGVASVSNKGTKTFTIKVKTNAGVTPSCEYSGTFTVTYLSMIDDTNLTYFPSLCNGTTSFSTDDFKTWTYDNIAQNVNPDFWDFRDFTIQFSSDGINYNSNSVNPYNVNPLYVKMTKDGFSCEWNAKVQFTMLADVIANTPTTQLPPQCASATEYFDLEKLIPEINPDSDVTVTFHTSLSDAQTGNNPVSLQFRSGIGYTTLYIRVVNSLGCVASNNPSITLLVYYKPSLISSNPIVKTNCEGNAVFDLTQNISDLTDAQSPVEVTLIYQDQNGNVLSDDEVAHYDASLHGTKPSVIVKYNDTCSDVVTFDLQYKTKPVAKITTITVCDEKSYSLEDFKNQVISNASGYTFTDDNGNSLPSSFSLTSLPLQVKFLMTDNATGCTSDVSTLTFVQGSSTLLLTNSADLTECDVTDDRFDGVTVFNLDKVKSVFTTDASASFDYYRDASLTQKIDADFINTTAFSQTVFAKITSSGMCPVMGQIHLKVNTPTKSSMLEDTYYICYGDQLIVEAGTENVSFQWSGGTEGASSQERIFTEAGSYSVTLTNANGCSYTHSFVISEEHQPKIVQINQDNDKIEVLAEGGIQPYEYSFDGGSTWQSSNLYLNPTKSQYDIQVRSTLEDGSYCLGEIKSVYTITINNVITPNGDGKNDIWYIKNIDKMQEVMIRISDRYGKIVFSNDTGGTDLIISPLPGNDYDSNMVWDGKRNGRVLPTGTYWYVVKWYDSNRNKNETRTGWILLKNRD